MKASTTETLINAMRVLANDIQSEDGVANAAIYEAAERLEQLDKLNKVLSSNSVSTINQLNQRQQQIEQHPIPPIVNQVLLWALWHHMGGKSDIGQPIREFLGIGAHEELGEERIAIAKSYKASILEEMGINEIKAQAIEEAIINSVVIYRSYDTHDTVIDSYDKALRAYAAQLREGE